MSCDDSEGYAERIATKVGIAGCFGVVVGSVLSILQHAPFVRHTATSAASFALLMGCFSATQEASRRIRCKDSIVNSALGGATTGALLFGLHKGSVPQGIAICGALGAAAHLASDKTDLDGNIRSILVAIGLLDEAALVELHKKKREIEEIKKKEAILLEKSGVKKEKSAFWGWITPYLPVRKMSDEEWKEYTAKKNEKINNDADSRSSVASSEREKRK